MKKVAVVCAKGIGDGLTWMVMAHNLSINGYKVVVYSDILSEIDCCFPSITILPFISDIASLNTFDLIVSDDHSHVLEQKKLIITELLIPREHFFDRRVQRIDNILKVLSGYFDIHTSLKDNGIACPFQGQKSYKHVAIHPTASDIERNWGKNRYKKLAEKIVKMGFTVSFIMRKDEVDQWSDIDILGVSIFGFKDLLQTAEHISKSNYFIGSDSGIGHLASNLGIPTVSIFVRKSHSLNWRPGWSDGIVVSPINIVPTRYLRLRVWRSLITVGMITRAFKNLVNST